jgi:hypothetical protein
MFMIRRYRLTYRLCALTMTDSTAMPPSQPSHALAVHEAFELYARALTAHRQQNPPLTFAGLMASQFAAGAIRHHRPPN